MQVIDYNVIISHIY